MQEGIDYYITRDGKYVFTEIYLKKEVSAAICIVDTAPSVGIPMHNPISQKTAKKHKLPKPAIKSDTSRHSLLPSVSGARDIGQHLHSHGQARSCRP